MFVNAKKPRRHTYYIDNSRANFIKHFHAIKLYLPWQKSSNLQARVKGLTRFGAKHDNEYACAWWEGTSFVCMATPVFLNCACAKGGKRQNVTHVCAQSVINLWGGIVLLKIKFGWFGYLFSHGLFDTCWLNITLHSETQQGLIPAQRQLNSFACDVTQNL